MNARSDFKCEGWLFMAGGTRRAVDMGILALIREEVPLILTLRAIHLI